MGSSLLTNNPFAILTFIAAPAIRYEAAMIRTQQAQITPAGIKALLDFVRRELPHSRAS